MGRPLLGSAPLTAAEKTRRHRQKKRQMREQPPPTPQPTEPTPEELRREISALRRENDRLRTEASVKASKTLEDVPAAVPVPSQNESASITLDEEVEADEGPPTSIWGAVLRAERLRKAGKPL
ncbi:hypothetical protein [Mesorhizobium sp.]|uniref:hypothetical protein n=1 Tax=Mesorhizobium sp. TaxID=1871066 RepID=UPI0011F4126C|nr:hypothetical protein [Mesorhizobium sp.]TIM38295.1 MAG: hypothetical protein E5Y56_30175 [Mesorhizobium sp.]